MPDRLAGEPPPTDQSSSRSIVSAVARVYWMIVGNCLLYIAALAIAQGRAWGSAIDALFWLTAASLVAVRYLDVRLLGGTTASGTRATFRDWYVYSRTLLAASLALWMASRALAWAAVW